MTFPIPDQVATTDPRPPALSAEGHRLAILKPAHRKQSEETVELLARVGKGMVKVRSMPQADRRTGEIPKPGIWAVYPFRLVDAVTRRQLRREDMAPLPWAGAGPDPEREKETTR